MKMVRIDRESALIQTQMKAKKEVFHKDEKEKITSHFSLGHLNIILQNPDPGVPAFFRMELNTHNIARTNG